MSRHDERRAIAGSFMLLAGAISGVGVEAKATPRICYHNVQQLCGVLPQQCDSCAPCSGYRYQQLGVTVARGTEVGLTTYGPIDQACLLRRDCIPAPAPPSAPCGHSGDDPIDVCVAGGAPITISAPLLIAVGDPCDCRVGPQP